MSQVLYLKIDLFHSINGYAEGEDLSILVNSTLLIKQSNVKSDEQTKEMLQDLLKNYTDLKLSRGIFGQFPLGYDKN